MRKQLLFILLILLPALACGPLSSGETLEVTETLPPAETPAGPGPGLSGGRCGDGICDEMEEKNPSLCPQDCAPTEAPSVETPVPPTPSPGRARLRLEWQSSYGDCPGRQVDNLYAEMEFAWSLTEDGDLTGSGEGTMYAEAVSRCPGTDYGGVRTPEPYPVAVTGSVSGSGWRVELVATDLSQAYFTSSAVYREECILCWVLPEFKGLGVNGSLSSFSLPRELQAGDTFRFEMDHHIPQPGASYTNDHVGTATVEILEVPH